MARVASRDGVRHQAPVLARRAARADALRGPRFRDWSNRPRRHDGRGRARGVPPRGGVVPSDPRVRRAGCSDRLLSRGPRVRRTSHRGRARARVPRHVPRSGLPSLLQEPRARPRHHPLDVLLARRTLPRGGPSRPAAARPGTRALGSRRLALRRGSLHRARPCRRVRRSTLHAPFPDRGVRHGRAHSARPLSARESAGAQPPSVDRASSGSPARPVVDSGCVIDGPPRADSTRTGRGASARAGRFAT